MMDYEISLVPNIKAEMIHKRKMRDVVAFISIIVMIGCGALIAFFLVVMGTQKLTISRKLEELNCRIDGSGKNCSKYGTPVLSTENLESLLTIQGQFASLDEMNQEKNKVSRIFGLLDVILLNNDDYQIKAGELEISLIENTMMTFDAYASSKKAYGFDAIEAFEKSAKLTRIDYGDYMRYDSESGGYVKIPTYCISESVEDGIIYGTYKKYSPGCEAPMILDESEKSILVAENNEQPDSETNEASNEDNKNEESKTEEKNTKKKVELVKIRRTYLNSGDLESYKMGEDKFRKDGEPIVKDYYFESECNVYSDDESGNIDEDASLEKCPLIMLDEENSFTIERANYSSGNENEKGQTRFEVSIIFNDKTLKASSHFMTIVGPEKRNVTDSYLQIRDMFTVSEDKAGNEEK